MFGMQTYQQILNALWIALGASIAVYSYRLGVWQSGGPATGFMPLSAGILICGLGTLQFLQGTRGQGDAEPASFFPDRAALRRVVSVIAALVTVALLMERLGFLLTAFLTVLFLLTVIELRGWLSTIVIALAASTGVWWLFTRLDVVLPRGPWGF